MKWTVCLSSAAVVLALTGALFFFKRHETTFHHLNDAYARMAASGFRCTSDSARGHVSGGFMISRENLTWSQVGTMCKSGPMGPEWEGRVWVTLNPEYWRLAIVPERAGTRVWGAVVAFGDEGLLRDIDVALAESASVGL